MGSKPPQNNPQLDQQIAMNQAEINQKRAALREQQIAVIKAASGPSWASNRPPSPPGSRDLLKPFPVPQPNRPNPGVEGSNA